MAETKTEKTIADELREAASRLRETGTEASRPPWRRDGMAIVTGSGTAALAYNGVDADWIALASPALAEHLASWLDETADDVDPDAREVHLGPDETYSLVVVNAKNELRGDATAALAVARVLNGTAPQEVSAHV